MLLKLREKYLKGEITTKELLEEAFDFFQLIKEYQSVIKESNVEKLEITGDDVIYDIKNDGVLLRICDESQGGYSIVNAYFAADEVENEVSTLIYKYLKNDSVVFDVDANIGWYTINIKKRFSNVKIYTFEPIPNTYGYLIKNMQLNELSTQNVYNMGLSDKKGTAEFFYNKKASSAASMRDLQYVKEEKSECVQCTLTTIDDFCKENDVKKLDIIKCDVEGAELFVYYGAKETLKTLRPIVFSEMLRKWSKLFEYHPNDIISFFKSVDYICVALNKNGKLNVIHEVTEDTQETNYMFLPMEREGEIYE